MGEIANQLGISGGLLLAQIVNFLIVMFILRALLYQPVLNMMEQRKARIADSLKDAERANTAAQEAEQEKAAILEEARREAQEVRAQSTRDAERIGQEVRSRAEEEAQEIRMKAQTDAEEQRASALDDVNKQIADLAILATERILGRELANESEQRRFVQDFLEQRDGSAS